MGKEFYKNILFVCAFISHSTVENKLHKQNEISKTYLNFMAINSI